MTEDQVGAELMKRASRLNQQLVVGVLVAALALSLGLTLAVVSDGISGGFLGAKLLGLTGGMTWAASFATSVLVGLFLGRRFLISSLHGWILQARRQHGIEAGVLDYIVSMYAQPHPKQGAGSEHRR